MQSKVANIPHGAIGAHAWIARTNFVGMQPRSAVARQFGKAVKDLRLKKGRTQQVLADACGLDISYVGQIERGQRSPTLRA